MTASPGTQSTQLLLALLSGLFLGVVYDLCRAPRRVHPRSTMVFDLFFALLCFLVYFLTAVYTGGLKLYQVAGIFAGSGLWFLTGSPILLRFGVSTALKLHQCTKLLEKHAKKSVIFLRKPAKKFFSSLRKWGTIGMIPFSSMERHTKGSIFHDKETHKKISRPNHNNLDRMESRLPRTTASGRTGPVGISDDFHSGSSQRHR